MYVSECVYVLVETTIKRHQIYIVYKQPKFISYSSGEWVEQGQGIDITRPSWVDDPMLSWYKSLLSVCSHIVGRGASGLSTLNTIEISRRALTSCQSVIIDCIRPHVFILSHYRVWIAAYGSVSSGQGI